MAKVSLNQIDDPFSLPHGWSNVRARDPPRLQRDRWDLVCRDLAELIFLPSLVCCFVIKGATTINIGRILQRCCLRGQNTSECLICFGDSFGNDIFQSTYSKGNLCVHNPVWDIYLQCNTWLNNKNVRFDDSASTWFTQIDGKNTNEGISYGNNNLKVIKQQYLAHLLSLKQIKVVLQLYFFLYFYLCRCYRDRLMRILWDFSSSVGLISWFLLSFLCFDVG